MPALRHASAGDATRELGWQSTHLRLTDVENTPDASPPEHLTPIHRQPGGPMNAGRLTNGLLADLSGYVWSD